MHSLNFSSSDGSNYLLFENSSNDSSGNSTDSSYNQDSSSHKRNKLPRINLSPRRNTDRNYEISPPSSPPVNNPHRKYKSSKSKLSSKDKSPLNTKQEDYKVRIIQKNEQSCLIIMENPNSRPKPSHSQLPRISLTPLAEDERQSTNTSFQVISSPRSDDQICQMLLPSSTNPVNAPTKKPRRKIHLPKKTNSNKKQTKPEDFHAQIIENYGNREWVGIIGIQSETELSNEHSALSSSQANQFQSTTTTNNFQSNEYNNNSPMQQSVSTTANDDYYEYHNIMLYNASIMMVSSDSNPENDEEADDQVHNHDSQIYVHSTRINDHHDLQSNAHIHTEEILMNHNGNPDDSASNSTHWNIEGIVDKKGPWTEYHVTSKDVIEDTKCSICYDEFEKGQKTSKLICGHFFHEDCILKWYDQNHHSPTCPVCRRNMNDP